MRIDLQLGKRGSRSRMSRIASRMYEILLSMWKIVDDELFDEPEASYFPPNRRERCPKLVTIYSTHQRSVSTIEGSAEGIPLTTDIWVKWENLVKVVLGPPSTWKHKYNLRTRLLNSGLAYPSAT